MATSNIQPMHNGAECRGPAAAERSPTFHSCDRAGRDS
jgi:hypothetical protein